MVRAWTSGADAPLGRTGGDTVATGRGSAPLLVRHERTAPAPYPGSPAANRVRHAGRVRRLELGTVVPARSRVVRREAAKAVVERDGLLLLLVTPASGDHKLPGGGVRPGESHEQTVARELREETGHGLAALGPAVLHVVERRADAFDHDAVFEMVSTYYRATVSLGAGATGLDDYERDLGLTAVWIAPAEALRANEALLAAGGAAPWTARETEVLRLVLDGEI